MVVRSKPASSSFCESCRARSGRKLKKITESPVSIPGRPSKCIGSTNSSVTPASYCCCTYCDGARPGDGLRADDGVERALGAIPALVAVHRVVPPRDRRDPLLGQLGEVVDRGMRRDVAAVGERVDPRLLGRKPEQRAQVVDVRVHAPVRHEPEQVDIPPALERLAQHLVLEQRPVLDRAVHAHQVLEEDPSRADRQVADLRVAHLARRQPDRLAGRLQGRVRVLGPEPVEHRRVGQVDGVARTRRCAAPAVEDDQRYEGRAALHIAVNDWTSSEAPPTSAPPTSGCASSSAAFSGLTEPP